jgi:hypothetical protein
MLVWVALSVLGWSGGVRLFCCDETRLGLKTLGGCKITTKGVKPIGTVQWQFPKYRTKIVVRRRLPKMISRM